MKNVHRRCEHRGIRSIDIDQEHVDHFKVAAILGHVFGIGVRNGCFCAHPLILHLLEVNEEDARRVREEIIHHKRDNMPGLIRASFGLYNTLEDIDEKQIVKLLNVSKKAKFTC